MYVLWYNSGRKDIDKMEAIKDYTEEIQEACANIKNQLIIDDIFDIARGVYNSYNDYVHAKQKIIEEVRKHNNSCLAIGDNKYTFTYYAEPVIINEHDFYYVIDKYVHNIR